MSGEENHSNDLSTTKLLIADTKICSICLFSGSTDDNDPIVFCDRCGIIVHESCYNADTLDEKSSDSSSPSEYWFCTPCLAQIDHPTCALCPTEDDCQPYWPTLESSWVHVVCALAIPGVLFYDELYYTPVDISNIPSQRFGNKMCQLCESRSGVTISCDAGLCPNSFHLSCANKNGLLQIRGELSKIECELYCVTHQSSSNAFKKVQRNFTICEVQQKELDHRKNFNEQIRETLIDHWSMYKKRSESFPRLPKPNKSHLARSLIVDPIALKEFFAKAQHLHSNTSITTTSSMNVDLTSTDKNALLAFTTNEEELHQLRQNLLEAENKFIQLESSTIENELKDEHNQLENQLNAEYQRLTCLTNKYNEFIEIFQKYHCELKDQTTNYLIERKSSTKETHCCSICQEKDRSSQMIKCCQCYLLFHGHCLTPAMPVKTLSAMLSATNKYDWQCASCVNVQQEELDQCHVNIDQPRQVRPRKTNELVLRETMIKFGSRKRKEGELSNLPNEQINEKKKMRMATDQSEETNLVMNSTKSDSIDDEDKSMNSQCRTSVIKQLFTRKTTDFTPQSSAKRKSTSARKKSSTTNKSSRISIKKSSPSKTIVTPVRSPSLTNERRTATIFKQKALSFPLTKSQKKKHQITTTKRKDPMSIFDFYDDDENANEIVELRSSSATNDQEKLIKQENKPKRNTRRSTLTIANNIPSDASCRECAQKGTNQTMTDCDKCQHFYHYACCVPPLNSFPKRRNYGWTCHRCNDSSDNETSSPIINSSPANSRRERLSHHRYADKDFLLNV